MEQLEACGRWTDGTAQGDLDATLTLREMAVEVPEPPERADHGLQRKRVRLGLEMVEGFAQVVVVAFESIDPLV